MKLEEKMTNGIQDAAAAFEECIKALLHGKVDHIDSNVTTIKDQVSESKTVLLDVNQRMVTVEKGVLAVEKGVEGLKEKNIIINSLAETLAGIKSQVDRS